MIGRLRIVARMAAVCALSGTLAAQESKPPPQGSIRGKVSLALPGLAFKDIGPVVAYLDAVEGALKFAVPKEVPTISQRNATFQPKFLIVTAGQTVEMPNDDKIVHNVFSFSKPNTFDLGLYPKGESKSVPLKHPGVVDLFCSIHSQMNATIFVAPSPYHAVAANDGSFEIKEVPAGKYRLKTWTRKLPEASQAIDVAEGKVAQVDLSLGAKQ